MLCIEVDEVDGMDETVIGGRMRWPTLTFKVPPVCAHKVFKHFLLP